MDYSIEFEQIENKKAQFEEYQADFNAKRGQMAGSAFAQCTDPKIRELYQAITSEMEQMDSVNSKMGNVWNSFLTNMKEKEQNLVNFNATNAEVPTQFEGEIEPVVDEMIIPVLTGEKSGNKSLGNLNNANAFFNKVNGKAFDIDGAFGTQCVDGFKKWCQMNGVPVKAAPGDYANGYWIGKDNLGYSNYFEYVTGAENFKDGDWVIWDYGSSSHPKSHIGMYYQGKVFGQNQGQGAFNLINTDFSDALGALRPKVYTDE